MSVKLLPCGRIFAGASSNSRPRGRRIAFRKGQVVELNDASADRWRRRGVCVFVGENAPTRKKRSTKKKTTKKKAAAKKA